MRKDRSGSVFGAAVVIVVMAVIVGIGWFLDAVGGYNPLAATLNALHAAVAGFAPWKLFWLFAIAGVPLAVMSALKSEDHNSSAGTWFGVGAFVVLAAGVGLSISPVNRWGHDVTHRQVNQVLEVVEGRAPEFEVRNPFKVAYRDLTESIGDSSGFEVPRDNVWRFEVDGEARTCGLKLPVSHQWKRPVAGVACVDDNGKVAEASFSGDVPSWHATFGHLRLAGAVNDAFPRGRFVISDVYGFIDAEGPHMVVPVTTMRGGLGWHEGWAGALVFDADGTSRKVTDPAEVPGPVVGESTADRVLNALNHRGGFIASKQAETGYDLGEGENVTHLYLERADGSGERLVTLLTPRGTSETVTAVLEIDPHTIVDGWPAATLYRLPTRTEGGKSRASVAEVIDLVRQRYGTAMQLAQSKLELMEATPADHDELVITVGSDRQVFARASVDMMTRETCVYTPGGVEVQCDPGGAAPLPLGSLRGLFSGSEVPSTIDGEGAKGDVPGRAAVPTDLSELTDVELTELLRQLADELDARRSDAVPVAG